MRRVPPFRSTTSSPDAFRSCSRALPSLPAINETVPGVVSSGWLVLMAPAGTPDAIIQKVNADVRKVVVMPDVVERFQTLGTYSRDLTPAQTAEFMRSEERLW